MLITPANLDALRTQFSLDFQKAYDVTEPWWMKIATEVPSSTKSNTYGWVEKILTLRKWVGPRIAANLKAQSYVITNQKFEGTVEVDRDDIEDDNLGLYSSMIVPALGAATKKHPDQLLKALIQRTGDYAATVAYDGLSFFNDAHTIGPFTYDNLFATTPLTAANFSTVWAAMAQYKGEDGEPLGIMPNLIIVDPTNKKAALEILNTTYIVGQSGAENVLKGWADVLVIPEIGNQPGTWYLADTSKPIKPFVWQKRRAPNFVSRDNPADPKVFDLNMYTYGVDYRGEVGLTLPFLMAKCTP